MQVRFLILMCVAALLVTAAGCKHDDHAGHNHSMLSPLAAPVL